jgi:hypothetical protein
MTVFVDRSEPRKVSAQEQAAQEATRTALLPPRTPPKSMVAVADAIYPKTDQERVNNSRLIALVTVVRCEAARWTTPGNQMGIYRPVILQVDQPLKAATKGQMLTVSAAGGVVDGYTVQWLSPIDRFARGERALAFLAGPYSKPDGSQMWSVVAKETIDATGLAANHRDGGKPTPLAQRLSALAALGVAPQ